MIWLSIDAVTLVTQSGLGAKGNNINRTSCHELDQVDHDKK
jgi:hypothetical protein